jgi:hypothetical protein
LAKEYAKGIGIDFKVATQTLKGVVSPYERIYLEMALDTGVVDIIGSRYPEQMRAWRTII